MLGPCLLLLLLLKVPSMHVSRREERVEKQVGIGMQRI